MKSRTVLVTGSSRGIGAEIARSFVRNGYHVIINANHSTELLYKLEKELNTLSPNSCLAYEGDMSDAEQAGQLFEQIESLYGGVDILVNNAGISYMGLLTDMSNDDWNTIINTNLSSVFYCSRAAIPYMVQQKRGHIINISSVWGTTGASCEVAYSASKGGMNAFTRALAKELAPSNIQVNAIACGAIDTDMNQMLCEEERAALCEEIPAGRFGTPEEAAALALQLADSTSYLTGQIIALDGGWI